MVGTFAPSVGAAFMLAEDLHLVLAPNPSPMTYLGTNTYILGRDQLAVIDPGPNDPAHLSALLKVIGDRKVTHILVTHSHLDHAPLAFPLSHAVGAPVCAYGDSIAGQSVIMRKLAATGLVGGGEGVDRSFRPDISLKDGQQLTTDEWSLTALHTPGHMGNHMCFVWDDALFSGDHVMGWSSSLVSPPDGDVTDFMTSCAKLATVPAQRYFPGHGAPIEDPAARLDWLMNHRRSREAEIIAALKPGPLDVAGLTRAVYADLSPKLLIAAERNVFAHLIDLVQRNIVIADPDLRLDAHFGVQSAAV